MTTKSAPDGAPSSTYSDAELDASRRRCVLYDRRHGAACELLELARETRVIPYDAGTVAALTTSLMLAGMTAAEFRELAESCERHAVVAECKARL